MLTVIALIEMPAERVDGIFINRWEGSGMCFCEHCKSNFKAASGFDLPATDEPQNPARRHQSCWLTLPSLMSRFPEVAL